MYDVTAFTSTYIVLTALAGVLNVFVALYALMSRALFSGKLVFILMALANSFYTFGAALEKTSETLYGMMLWTTVQYAGMPFSAVLTLLLALHFLGKADLIPAWGRWLLFVIPSITFLLVLTNSHHHLFYQDIYFHRGPSTPTMDFTMGEWYVVHGCYTFGTLFAALCLMFQALLRPGNKAYRRQLIALFAGILLPITASLLYLLGFSPNGVDPVPVVLCFTSLLFVYAFLSTDKMALLPVARENVMESMGEGVLVLDASWRLLDSNRSARVLLPALARSALGQSLGSLELPDGAAAAFRSAWEQPGKPYSFASPPLPGEEPRWCEVYAAPISRGGGQAGGCLLVLSDITERRSLQEELKRLASRDPLTGILNRGAFMREAEEALGRCFGDGLPVSMILFDIDHFKGINDTLGHEAGDSALLHAVSVCSSLLGPDVLFARYGGEEFVLLLPGIDSFTAEKLAESIRMALESTPALDPDGRPLGIRASFGVAGFGRAALPVQYGYRALFRSADQALYAAKEQGRNRVISAPSS